MANILFKRGKHSALPTTAVDGAFYLTTDSHRLYAGIGDELVDLNKYIRTAARDRAQLLRISERARSAVQSKSRAYGNVLHHAHLR